ncbi:cytochrome P450 [Aspergillus pseudoustus]|uniref:Cytochrome P450 n=1 Tax=Aspergillus pseudoustus TaxID=1810923 RepID=A0ABR4KG09_9EURO
MLTLILFLSAPFVLQFLLKFYLARRQVWKLQQANLPMPPFSLLTGHFPALKAIISAMPRNATIHSMLLALSRQFPSGLFYINMWPFQGTWLIVANPSAASQIQALNLPKPDIVQKPLETITGGPSLNSMNGEVWKRWRALFNPGFNPTYIIGLAPGVVDEVEVFCAKLRERAGEGRGGEIFQLEELTMKYTVDTICKVALDSNLHHQTTPHPLAVALQRQVEWASFGTTFNPFKRWLTIRPLVLWYNNRTMNSFIYDEIDRAYHNPPDRPTKSVIALALKQYMKEEEEEQKRKGGAKKLDPAKSLEEFKRRVAPQLRVFLFAGRSTTSSTLLYVYYLLAKHPGVLEKVRAEHASVFGEDYPQAGAKIRHDPTLINQLPYTLAVIKETLRLFPPAASMREGREGVEIIGDDGTRYPTAGFNVWTLSVALHHNSTYWKEVETFIPERWLVGPEDPMYPVKGAWRAFEFGPRSCIGQTLATLEMRIALVMTLREFDIVPAYDEWDAANPSAGIKVVDGHRAYQSEKGGGGAHPADGLPVRVAFRK